MQKLELEGYRFKITLQAQYSSYDRPWGEYDMFLKTHYQWDGVGVIQNLDSNDISTFSFTTGGTTFEYSLFNSVFNTQRGLSWGRKLSELQVVDQKRVVDWMAEKVVAQDPERIILIPDLDTKELMQLGAIADEEGQIHLGF